ncbi:NAD(P)-dependent oxidoreductase [Actinotalea sp. K2]|uniref:NAD(P)-dependent oxidoreductase n=1 Tax=Actinotalea sp. K2 TaxID=2939438 RepID=UPI002016C240|nr:NAD(P)H-binding protein [Actinotalea sp. K2]MCL3861248.1 NAD(P)H-binding protein [Actinotalea sp. K2]
MELAVFGATGTVGRAVVARALLEGHHVKALVRPRPRPRQHLLDPSVEVVPGDAKDPAAVLTTLEGADAVLSSLGGFDDPASMGAGTVNVLAGMSALGIRRLVVMQGFHLDFPGDPDNLGRRVILPLLWLGNRRLLPESRAMADAVRSSDVDWTVVRAPRVVEGPVTSQPRTGHLRLGPWSSVTRGDVARLMLTCLTDPTTIRTAPMIATTRRSRQLQNTEVSAPASRRRP